MVPQMTGLNELPGMVGGQLPTSGFEQYVPVYAARAAGRASVERRRETRESRIVGVVGGQDGALSVPFCLALSSGSVTSE